MKKHVILAVDDDGDTLDILAGTIESLGCVPLKAADQAGALKILETKRPCMILLDLQIKTDRRSPPRIESGFNLLRMVRRQYPKGELLIILISAHARGKDNVVNMAYRDGINDYVRKPYDDGDLVNRIELGLRSCPAPGCGSNIAGSRTTSANSDLYFDGNPNERGQYLIKVFGKDVWVSQKTFEVLWTLALERLKGKGGWLKARVIVPGSDNPYMAIQRAKKNLASVWPKIIQKGHHQFRIKLSPDRIGSNDVAMREQFEHLIHHSTNPSFLTRSNPA